MATKFSRLIDIIDDDRRPIAEKLVRELSFMSSTLAKLRADVRKNGEIIEGSTGPKTNPALTAYNTTIQRYALINKQFIDLLPPAAKPEAKDELAEFLRKGKSA